MAIRFIGDFMYSYPSDWDTVLKTAYGEEMKKQTMELMQRHYEFYGEFSEEDSYVTSGSILYCSAGTELSAFDLPLDHAVERSDGAAVGTCADCRENENIISFGYCANPTPEGYPKRCATASFAAPGGMVEKEKCIPMLDAKWQEGSGNNLMIYDQTSRKYFKVLTTGAFLTCFYGGIIRVVEVYEGYDKIQAIDRIEKIKKCGDEQINTIKYVIKALLIEGYKREFVCGAAGNIIAEGGQAGHFESAAYGDEEKKRRDKPAYLQHMVKYHHYRPGDWEEEETWDGAEYVSGHNIYDLESGTGIFSKQLGWDSTNKRFVCDACGGENGGEEDHICFNHKFGFGICQWTDNGINSKGELVETGRLPLLIIKYLEEFGENAKPDWRECCRVEVDYLCQELQSPQYKQIMGINKEECTLEGATESFLREYEKCSDMDGELQGRIENAQNVWNAIEEVWGHE